VSVLIVDSNGATDKGNTVPTVIAPTSLILSEPVDEWAALSPAMRAAIFEVMKVIGAKIIG